MEGDEFEKVQVCKANAKRECLYVGSEKSRVC